MYCILAVLENLMHDILHVNCSNCSIVLFDFVFRPCLGS